MSTDAIHLAWGADGAAIEVPDEATYWRVRLLPPKGGHPKVLRRDGLPLAIPITATVELLREAVDGKPGLYRLDPCTDHGAEIRNADFAVIEIVSDDDTERTSAKEEERDRAIATLAKANADMAQALTQALAQVVALAEAALKRGDNSSPLENVQ